MRSEYLAYLCRWYCWCNNLFEIKNKDNVFLIISALSIIWSQNWSLQQILGTTELNSAIDLKFIRQSRDHLRHASKKNDCPMLIIIFFECNPKFEWILVQYLEIWVKMMSQKLWCYIFGYIWNTGLCIGSLMLSIKPLLVSNILTCIAQDR
jgi:hypothetical protein